MGGLASRAAAWAKRMRPRLRSPRFRKAAVMAFLLTAVLVIVVHPPDEVRRESTAAALPTRNDIELLEPMDQLRKRLVPSVWARSEPNFFPAHVPQQVSDALVNGSREAALALCGRALYSSLLNSVVVGSKGLDVFVRTGDINDMWTRDSAVQIGLYIGRMKGKKSLRLLIEGAIRRQAFNIVQDPYANSYLPEWVDPTSLRFEDRVIGRGGWVASRNYELDSGAYFLTQIYDYFVAEDLYRPDLFLSQPSIYDAVLEIINVWIVEQHHDRDSPYRYFELQEQGIGAKSSYTGMTWSGFRPSDDPCRYGYNIPANIYAAAALERVIELNKHIWKCPTIATKAQSLHDEISVGIAQYGVVKSSDGSEVYAYEVDGLGRSLVDFDDANVPSLLSIPLLGWSGYSTEIYQNTRRRILSPETNAYYTVGKALRGIGSPHTPRGFVWPMAFSIEALTAADSLVDTIAFQVKQSVSSSCLGKVMHESVNAENGCEGGHTRNWFEWSNALLVVLVESALGTRCEEAGAEELAKSTRGIHKNPRFHSNPYQNDPNNTAYFQGLAAFVKHNS